MTARSFLLLVGDDGAFLVPPRGLNIPVKSETESILETLTNFPRAPLAILADTLAQDYKSKRCRRCLSSTAANYLPDASRKPSRTKNSKTACRVKTEHFFSTRRMKKRPLAYGSTSLKKRVAIP